MTQSRMSRRSFLQFSAAGGALLALAACAPAMPASQAPAAESGAETAGPYQGEFVIMSSGNADQYAPLIEAIEAAHPGVTVQWNGLTSERYTELFAAAEIAGDQIDVMDLNGQDLRRYAVGGRLMDLSDLDYLDRFRPVGITTYTISGTLWALPRGGINGFTFLYNKKLLDEIGVEEPVTYSDIVQMAPALRELEAAPFVHPGKNIYLWPIWQFFTFAQTSGNQPVEKTWDILSGNTKFTDPESVAALDILNQYARDGLFVEGVNSIDRDGTWILFSQGKGGFYYEHASWISTFREQEYPDLDMSLIPPVLSIEDQNLTRMLPGGTGSATGIYSRIAPERVEVAQSILDLMTSDEWVKWSNELNADPVSTNVNVQASDDPLALKYAEQCAPNQITYLDWYWPPEITRSFQENQQAIVAGTMTPDDAAASIQNVLDDLYADGYEFEI